MIISALALTVSLGACGGNPAMDQGTPVFVSEFGICEASGTGNIDYDSAARWMGIMDQYNLSFAVWNLSSRLPSFSFHILLLK